jgi:hypothetical protein
MMWTLLRTMNLGASTFAAQRAAGIQPREGRPLGPSLGENLRFNKSPDGAREGEHGSVHCQGIHPSHVLYKESGTDSRRGYPPPALQAGSMAGDSPRV